MFLDEIKKTGRSKLNGSLNMEKMISHHFALSEAPNIFEKFKNHSLDHRKIILNPELENN